MKKILGGDACEERKKKPRQQHIGLNNDTYLPQSLMVKASRKKGGGLTLLNFRGREISGP